MNIRKQTIRIRAILLPMLVLVMAFAIACGTVVPQQVENTPVPFEEKPLNSTPESRQQTPAQESPPSAGPATSTNSEPKQQNDATAANSASSQENNPPTSASENKSEDGDAKIEQETEVASSGSTNDALGDRFFLEMISPIEDTTFAESSLFDVMGKTRVDAAVSVNDDLLDVDSEGVFIASVELEEGPNVIEVVASVNTGEPEASMVLTVFYLP